jgi:hypothetical protein
VHTALSRTAIDVSRDPSGDGAGPMLKGIERRKERYFAPYHAALVQERTRLRGVHKQVVLYDCQSIRSVIPRLFRGALPVFNIGTNDGKGCDSALSERIAAICAASRWSHVVDGRFKGGWITYTYGRPVEHPRSCDARLSSRRERSALLGQPFCQADPRDLAGGARRLPRVCPLLKRTPMPTRLDNARIIRAPRGPKLSAKSWLTEAPLRMLMNNLDPEVAEKPHELVVYGGMGRAARDWESFDRIVATLTALEAD